MGSVVSNHMLSSGIYIDKPQKTRRRKKNSQVKVRQGEGQQESRLSAKQLAMSCMLLLLSIAVVWSIFTFMVWFMKPATFPISHVNVSEGLQYTSHVEVSEAIAPIIADGFFGADAVAIYKAVLALPWVQAVEVKRVWPDSITLEVQEHMPFARWDENQIVTASGHLISVSAMPDAKLPLLAGPREQIEEVITAYNLIEHKLSFIGQSVAELSVDERGVWIAKLISGIQLKLGREDVQMHVDRLVSVFDVAIAPDLQRIDSIDLRYTNGLSIKWRSEQPTELTAEK